MATPDDREGEFKHTFIKLDFTPSFGLTDTGPTGEEAVAAWETILHDMYFLGGGEHNYESKMRSCTHWGRVLGTQNQVLIKTGQSRLSYSVFWDAESSSGLNYWTTSSAPRPPPPPLMARNAPNETPEILLPLKPFLLHAPVIINVCFENCTPSTHSAWSYACELRFFHLPQSNLSDNAITLHRLRSLRISYDSYHGPRETLDFNIGGLYPPEGRARSFMTENTANTLENKRSYVHLTHWKAREADPRFKNPNQHSIEQGNGLNDDWYESWLSHTTAEAEKRGAVHEVLRVDFKKWLELYPDYQQPEYAARFPGSIPTHEIHGQDCEQCAPFVD